MFARNVIDLCLWLPVPWGFFWLSCLPQSFILTAHILVDRWYGGSGKTLPTHTFYTHTLVSVSASLQGDLYVVVSVVVIVSVPHRSRACVLRYPCTGDGIQGQTLCCTRIKGAVTPAALFCWHDIASVAMLQLLVTEVSIGGTVPVKFASVHGDVAPSRTLKLSQMPQSQNVSMIMGCWHCVVGIHLKSCTCELNCS